MTIECDSKDFERIAFGIKLYNAFSWGCGSKVNFDSIMSFDNKSKEVLIDEQQLMKLIACINPNQKDRKIRLINNSSK